MNKFGVFTAVLASIAFLFSIAYILAASFSSTVSPLTIENSNQNKLLNFTVNKVGDQNITNVTVVIPARFSFISGSNGTTANMSISNATFTNVSSALSWNSTDNRQGFIQSNNSDVFFWLNVSVPRTIGNFSINVTTLNTSGQEFNSSLVYVFVDADVWSPSGQQGRQFGLLPRVARLNWTNNYRDNITVFANASYNNLTVEIVNGTSGLAENYTQGNPLSNCQVNGNFLQIQNATGPGNYLGLLNSSNEANATLMFSNFVCKPGRYSTATFMIRNSTQINETANITVIVDLPILTTNTLTASTGVGSFGGNIPVNATQYQSYFFDTSNITNTTSVVINMTGWSSSQDLDVFVLDNSSAKLLQAKSINKTATNEYLIFNYLPSTGKMWEIRVYANSTSSASYSGNIIFSGLNATNTSNTNQQFGMIDLGIKNASTVTNFNITLRNEANLTHSSVSEEKEIYYVKRFGGGSTINFSLVVPDSSIANRVAVSLNWTGGSNYSFNVVNSSGSVVIKSPEGNAYRIANVSGTNQELWNDTTSFGSSVDIWTIQVMNSTNVTDAYNVTAFVYVTASSWIASNYSSMTFNATGNSNFTRDVSINFTVPNNTLDGFYEGKLKYLDSNKAGISVPFRINVTAPVLFVNGTMSSKIFTIDENVGANLTRTLFFELNNSGSIDATTFLNSSGNLSCVSGSCSGYNGSLSFNSTSSLSKSSSQLIRAQISYNSSMPSGIYGGWIYINAANNTVALSSHPYDSFNISIRLNLTSNLKVDMLEIKSLLGNVMTRNSSIENVTVRFKLNYVNSTEIEAQNVLNTSNFSVWLVNRNVSNFRVPATGSLTLYNGTNPIYFGGAYGINASIPDDTVGGFFELHVLGNYTKNPSYSGEGTNSTFIVNNTGLFMSSNVSGCSFGSSCSASLSLTNSSTTVVNVNVSNFGNVPASSVTLTYSESCAGFSLSNPSATSGCSAGTLSGSTATISPAANSTSCVVSWTVTANSSAASACTGYISGSPTTKWFNPSGVNISITVTASSSSSSSSSGTSGGASATTTTTTTITSAPPVYLEFSSYPETLSIEQGSNKTASVTIKNTNSTVGQSVKLVVEGINSSWYSIDPSTEIRLAPTDTTDYEITITVPKNATIKDYSGTLKAVSNYTNVSQGFVLKVAPGQELKIDIDQDIINWETKIATLEKEINATMKKGLNTTQVEMKLGDLKKMFEQVKTLKEGGNYRGAFDLLKDVNDLYDLTSASLKELKEENKPSLFSYIKWVLLVIVVIAVISLAYLFWPQKGYSPGKGYTPPQKTKEEAKNKLKENYEKLQEKWKNVKKKD